MLESEEVSCYGIFHIGDFCFRIPFLKQLLLRNCAVDFVEICNTITLKVMCSRSLYDVGDRLRDCRTENLHYRSTLVIVFSYVAYK